MSKYNKVKTPAKVVPTAINDMGEKAYNLSDKEELVATTLTSFLQKNYYETENEVTKRIKDNLKKVDPLFAAKLAVYLRQDANMRSVSHLIAGELIKTPADWKARFFTKVLVRPDDMGEILSYYVNVLNKGKKFKMPKALKKAFKQKLESMDPYLIDKYKMKTKDFSLVDLVNLMHPVPTQTNMEAFRRLMKGESLEGLYESKIFEKEMSKAGTIAKESKGKVSVEEAKEEAITNVLGNLKGMPIMNLLRNLRNILEIAPDMVDEACKQLTIKDKVLKSRLLPFRFASAYDELVAVKAPSLTEVKKKASSIMFESDIKANTDSVLSTAEFNAKREQILDAIETALEYSVENIPSLAGKVAVLIDHSGSVRGDGGGHSRMSAFSKTTKAMVGNLFGSMIAWRQSDVYIGMFGDRLVSPKIDRSKRMLDFNKETFAQGVSCGGGTENGLYIFLDECIRNKTKVDYLCIFSDMVIGSGGRGGWDSTSNTRLGSFQDLFAKFRKVNPQCKTICVDINQTKGTSVFDKSMQVLQVAGWSDKIFDTIASNTVGYKELIKEIESIVI